MINSIRIPHTPRNHFYFWKLSVIPYQSVWWKGEKVFLFHSVSNLEYSVVPINNQSVMIFGNSFPIIVGSKRNFSVYSRQSLQYCCIVYNHKLFARSEKKGWHLTFALAPCRRGGKNNKCEWNKWKSIVSIQSNHQDHTFIYSIHPHKQTTILYTLRLHAQSITTHLPHLSSWLDFEISIEFQWH